ARRRLRRRQAGCAIARHPVAVRASRWNDGTRRATPGGGPRMAETALTGMRIVLLEPDAREASRLAQGLAALGAAVEVMDGVRSTIQRLRGDAPEAVLLAAPLPGADWIGLAALVKDAPEPPALVVLDGAGVAGALARALPAERGADAVLE